MSDCKIKLAIFTGTHYIILAFTQYSRCPLPLFCLIVLLIIPIIILLLLDLTEHHFHRLMLHLDLTTRRLYPIHASASLSQAPNLHCFINLLVNRDIAGLIAPATYRHYIGAYLLLQDLIVVV